MEFYVLNLFFFNIEEFRKINLTNWWFAFQLTTGQLLYNKVMVIEKNININQVVLTALLRLKSLDCQQTLLHTGFEPLSSHRESPSKRVSSLKLSEERPPLKQPKVLKVRTNAHLTPSKGYRHSLSYPAPLLIKAKFQQHRSHPHLGCVCSAHLTSPKIVCNSANEVTK